MQMFISRCIYLNFPHKHISEIQNRRERPFIAWLHVVYLLHDFTGVYHITMSEWDVQGGFLVMDTPERKKLFQNSIWGSPDDTSSLQALSTS